MKAMVGLIIAILVIVSLRLFWPSTPYGESKASLSEDVIKEESQQAEGLDVTLDEKGSPTQELNTLDDERTKLMTAEYDILQEERKILKRHVARLKHEMWGLKFAKEKSKQMSAAVMGASNLLRNPDMLGAFANVDAIKDEIAKVKFSQNSLQEVSEFIEASQNKTDAPD
jgi:hypothetical protein